MKHLAIIQSEFLKESVIQHCKKKDKKSGKPWCLYTKNKKRLLGRHPSRDKALAQERAVQSHK